MNRFTGFTFDELETILDALMFDRLDMNGLGEKLKDEAMQAFREKKKEIKA